MEDSVEDTDAAVDEEDEDEDEMLVEEDQVQNSVSWVSLLLWQKNRSDMIVRLEVSFFCLHHQEGDEDDAEEAADKLVTSHPDADTTILFTTGEGLSRFTKLQ